MIYTHIKETLTNLRPWHFRYTAFSGIQLRQTMANSLSCLLSLKSSEKCSKVKCTKTATHPSWIASQLTLSLP